MAKRIRHGYGRGVTITKNGKRVYLTGAEFMLAVHAAQGATSELSLTRDEKAVIRASLKRKGITRRDVAPWVR